MVGFTLDEKALLASGYHWFERLLEEKIPCFAELSPELRAAPLSEYMKIKKRLTTHNLPYQLHMPYFVHPTDYAVNSLLDSKQKIVNTLENWLSLTEKIRYNDDCIPIILHPGTTTLKPDQDQDLTAHFVELFLELLQHHGLSRHYQVALENLPKHTTPSFANVFDALMRFRESFFNSAQLSLCLDLCHFETNCDTSPLKYEAINHYHIHQFDAAQQRDHLSLSRGALDFTKHLEALKNKEDIRLNLELLLYAEPHYTQVLSDDLCLLKKALKD